MHRERKGDGGSKRTRSVGWGFVGVRRLFGVNLVITFTQTRSHDFPHELRGLQTSITCLTPTDMPIPKGAEPWRAPGGEPVDPSSILPFPSTHPRPSTPFLVSTTGNHGCLSPIPLPQHRMPSSVQQCDQPRKPLQKMHASCHRNSEAAGRGRGRLRSCKKGTTRRA